MPAPVGRHWRASDPSISRMAPLLKGVSYTTPPSAFVTQCLNIPAAPVLWNIPEVPYRAQQLQQASEVAVTWGDGYKSGAGGSGAAYGKGGATPARRADVFVSTARARMPRSAPSMGTQSRRERSRATSMGTR